MRPWTWLLSHIAKLRVLRKRSGELRTSELVIAIAREVATLNDTTSWMGIATHSVEEPQRSYARAVIEVVSDELDRRMPRPVS